LDDFVCNCDGSLTTRTLRTRQQAIDAVSAAVLLGSKQLRLPPAAVTMEYACGAIGALIPIRPT